MFNHGVDCDARTFPTMCNLCGEKVFYFSCSCGSKVFFDDLGIPWPKHNCHNAARKWARRLPKTVSKDGAVSVEIAPGITVRRPGESHDDTWNIDPDLVTKTEREAKSRDQNPIESVSPGVETPLEITGVVREVIRLVDVFKRFKLARTAMNAAFLRMLGTGDWSQITIHDLKAVIYSYTFWIRQRDLPRNGLNKGTTATVKLDREDFDLIPAREWVCGEFRLE